MIINKGTVFYNEYDEALIVQEHLGSGSFGDVYRASNPTSNEVFAVRTISNLFESIEPKLILIDGRALAEYMIDFDLGVSTTAIYQIKQVDLDYFVEE